MTDDLDTITLPDGYELVEPPPLAALLSETIPGQNLYNGASPFEAFDGAGTRYISCYAKNPAGVAAFRVFRYGPTGPAEVALPENADARGSLILHPALGRLRYLAFQGQALVARDVPGAAPLAEFGGLTLQQVKDALWQDPWFGGDWLFRALSWGADPRIAALLGNQGDATRIAALEVTTAQQAAQIAALTARLEAASAALDGR